MTHDESRIPAPLGRGVVNAPPPLPKLVFPAPMKYLISYRTTDGEDREFVISNPIEADDSKLTAYAFKHGIRSFIRSRITSFKPQT